MSTYDFIIELFCRVDDAMKGIDKDPRAQLHPSELVTLGLLRALKGGSQRAFFGWLAGNWHFLFPRLPERTRLMRLLAAHQEWADRFLAEPTLLGICDSYGIELIHPRREGRSAAQIGRKGLSNRRWIVGAKFCTLLNRFGLFVDWCWDSANVHDSSFNDLIGEYEGRMVVLTDSTFHGKEGDPENLKVCARGTWGVRSLVETVNSLLSGVFDLKKVTERGAPSLTARLSFVVCCGGVQSSGAVGGAGTGRAWFDAPVDRSVHPVIPIGQIAPLVTVSSETRKASAWKPFSEN